MEPSAFESEVVNPLAAAGAGRAIRANVYRGTAVSNHTVVASVGLACCNCASRINLARIELKLCQKEHSAKQFAAGT